MNQRDSSTLALAPIVRFFTYAAIKSMRMKNLPPQRHIIHSDMVPRFSENIIMASLGERQLDHGIHFQKSVENVAQPPPMPPRNMPPPQNQQIPAPAPQLQPNVPEISNMKPSGLEAPSPQLPPKPLFQDIPSKPPANLPTPPMPPAPPASPKGPMQQMLPPESPIQEDLSQFYGKITQLLNDPSVASIECAGMGRPVTVIRRGQKEPTRVVLGENDIKQVLEKVSAAAHIPLLEGVFRASVDNFSINAVVSEMIGSKFVIKKQPNVPLPPGGPSGPGGMPPMPPRF